MALSSSAAERPRPWRAGIGAMGNVSLAELIRQSFPEGNDASRVFCNSTGTAVKPPVLRRGVPNTIIMFSGRFNPPNINHVRLLRHVTRNAGQDLNIVGAIICIIDEHSTREKMEASGEGLDVLLGDKQRTDIWVGAGIPVDWVWVQDSSQCSLKDACSALLQFASLNGFDLRFLILCRPEHFSVMGDKEPENPYKWGCCGWITSDIGRSADFVSPAVGEPVATSKNFTPWTPVVPSAKDVRKIARSKFMLNGPEDLKGVSPAEILDEERWIRATAAGDWTCRYRGSRLLPVRFVSSPPDPHRIEVSSKEIREMIRCVGNQYMPGIEPALAPIVLHVRYLLGYAVERREEMELHGFDWEEYANIVEERLESSIAETSYEGDGGGGEPDEEALHVEDMKKPNEALRDINRQTRVSAIRSTLFTHADGARFLVQVAPTPRAIWGPNTYLNEDEPEEEVDEPAEWAPTYKYELPEV